MSGGVRHRRHDRATSTQRQLRHVAVRDGDPTDEACPDHGTHDRGVAEPEQARLQAPEDPVAAGVTRHVEVGEDPSARRRPARTGSSCRCRRTSTESTADEMIVIDPVMMPTSVLVTTPMIEHSIAGDLFD